MNIANEVSMYDAPRPGAFSPTTERYLSNVLTPHLESLGVRPHAAKIVAADIGQRLDSLLARWSDTTFRATVLLPSSEEATFYEPLDAPIEIRALVAATVRNSLLEDLNATRGSHPKLKPFAGMIGDARIPEITGAAIRYFASVDPASLTAAAPEDDVFGHLEERYPRAWAAISELATMPEKESESPRLREVPADYIAPNPAMSMSVSGNGIAPWIDAELATQLQRVLESSEPFFSDSFKMVSRNPEKLFWVIEFLLQHGKTFFTFNYFISPTYLARREPLLRPARGVETLSPADVVEKLENPTGLTAHHRAALALAPRP